ncbi:hypothetical protein MBM_03003 [Drepanopeziza brunnea f. sp. 'multigermtubi' MB_m1]|uniref:Uncharacterized protein n=1 Tax=Marssonina brunnea f. sp. multigermtubi (strain MB_m1) TaxID=1072389 RepID=K1X0Q6_MARBU|nr:uncharacterized protein MBM_03003 [Drepanopeziza brunnea f. sp. 'multigermtubi' MB_m1]EKD18761.1 hypothetical protein MBM_03003 [Drepanopeziza brunnea f. sp. 'multigermtubi' MB_m1]
MSARPLRRPGTLHTIYLRGNHCVLQKTCATPPSGQKPGAQFNRKAYEILSGPVRKRNYDLQSAGRRGGGLWHETDSRNNHYHAQHHQRHYADPLDEEDEEDELARILYEEFMRREIERRTKAAHELRDTIQRRLHRSHLWALLWKSTFWLVSVRLAYHMVMFAQYMVSGPFFIWGLRAVQVGVFYQAALLMSERGLSWKSAVILGYTMGAYFLFIRVRDRSPSAFIRFFMQWTYIAVTSSVGGFGYAWLVYDPVTSKTENQKFHGIPSEEVFKRPEGISNRCGKNMRITALEARERTRARGGLDGARRSRLGSRAVDPNGDTT